MKKYFITTSVLALVAITGAHAADVIQPQPVTPVYTVPAFSWTGFYVGAQVGWSWADAKVDTNLVPPIYDFGRNVFSPDPDGLLAGAYLGFNYDFGNNFVAGLETDFAWSDLDNTDTYILPSVYGVLDTNAKQKWAGATRVRLGYAADRFLPYIAGGVAYGKVDVTITRTDPSGRKFPNSGSETFVGWTAGAGVDYAVTDNILLRFEYRYTDLGSKNFSFEDTLKHETSYKTNDVRVGVAYKF